MTKPKNKPASPWLDCPGCGEPAIEAHGRGRHDSDGNFIEHRDACRCAWCNWTWFDGCEPVACKCGALVSTKEDDGYIYARVVNTPSYWKNPPPPEEER